jgi:ABC-type multidrug transport system ATPase subunit
MAVSGSSDQVMVRGRPKHVVAYLKDFLFDEFQARAPVKSLSGGEKARLLLAKLMALPSNLMIMDEPTNDLDVETLDLLQDILGEYDGTVLLVSHDRDFIDRIATATVALEGQGKATAYPGGWSDYVRQRVLTDDVATFDNAKAKVEPTKTAPKDNHASTSDRFQNCVLRVCTNLDLVPMKWPFSKKAALSRKSKFGSRVQMKKTTKISPNKIGMVRGWVSTLGPRLYGIAP